MLTTFMKWIASAALLGILSLPIFLRLQPPELFAVLRFLVAAGAAVGVVGVTPGPSMMVALAIWFG